MSRLLPRHHRKPPSSRRFASTVQPRFSSGTNEATVSRALAPLLSTSGGRWTLASDGRALERSFKFKTFAKTWDFMTAVSLQCKVKNHHPEWSNVYSTTSIRWTTHNPLGLSDKDVSMAAACDAIAKDFGELEPEPASCTARDLTDKAAAYATGDSCTPKK
ncbi:Pterin-4-alpha-carbinolamine dehydratase [Tolypocladium ophioglossoides CBS 100239]|uniref:4a-hydroxytetrahydrobiopterin dehydratase n=1 Tax=Tolypocladium ophioglossoides (strain CBS 100239) TaxID=1163406 RepID=A0A0L0NGF3_TOLOC|nr:Pterin-4-alpha-carbinolamine dehydratase [Tolypocladium ophioglossoides CBS 100239]